MYNLYIDPILHPYGTKVTRHTFVYIIAVTVVITPCQAIVLQHMQVYFLLQKEFLWQLDTLFSHIN